MHWTEESLRASWLGMVWHYDDFLQSIGWDYLRPFREVVAAIASSEWAARLKAGPSHEQLVVELPGSWPMRRVYAFPSEGTVAILRTDGVRWSDEGSVPVNEALPALLNSFEWLVGKERLTRRCT